MSRIERINAKALLDDPWGRGVASDVVEMVQREFDKLTDAAERYRKALEEVSWAITKGDLLVAEDAWESGRHEQLRKLVDEAMAALEEGNGHQ